ncbi:MAG: GNAT family N-acetyltransferase [Proteobacteria bacterium]|nr:GNAT family N-acetyltransferase [Pseudomonadota bacterium]
MEIVRLTAQWEAALEAFLETDKALNLFLLGFLEVHPIGRAHWFAGIDGDSLLGVVMLVPGRLAVPFSPDVAVATAIGSHLRRRKYRATMTVGPRAACDGLWTEWAGGTPTRCFFDQRLYVCREPPPGASVDGFRKALESEWKTIAVNSGLMEHEDLGRNPYEDDSSLHEAVVVDRIRSGRTWVIEREGELVFQINLGTTAEHGCQVGGTYVPPAHRGRGIATAGMRELCRRLLAKHACVTLHVNEANTGAVRTYERSGFSRESAMRLITLESPA